MADPTPGPLPSAATAEELGYDPDALARCDVELEVHGDGDAPLVDLSIFGDKRLDHVPVPERFIAGDGTIDVAGLVEWLGLTGAGESGLPDSVTPERGPDSRGEGEWRLPGGDDEGFYLGAYRDHRSLTVPVPGDQPGATPEAGDDVLTGDETVGSFSRPAIGDTDAWPDDVDGWRVAIRRLRRHALTLRAADVRLFYAGLDDQVLEHTDAGPVDQAGDPIVGEGDDNIPPGDSWDPATDPLDPALEEALRLEGVPGAFPPPDPAEAPPDPAAVPAEPATAPEEAYVEVDFDNTVAIGDEPDAPSDHRAFAQGCFGFLARRWGLALGVVVLLLLVLLYACEPFSSDDADDEPSPDESGQVSPEAEDGSETPEEVLRRATQELLDGRTAEVEQTFTVSTPQGDSVVPSVGAVDFETGESRLTVDVSSAVGEPVGTTTMHAVVTPDAYSFMLDTPGAPWVQTEPGEVNDSPEVTEAGLGFVGLGEALDPVAIARLVQAATDVTADTRAGQDVFTGTVTLPVAGDGVGDLGNLDNWAEATYGNPQPAVAGVQLQTELVLGPDDEIEIGVVANLEEAIPLLEDDPEAENLRGITLSNRIVFTIGAPFDGPTAEDPRTLIEFITPTLISPTN